MTTPPLTDALLAAIDNYDSEAAAAEIAANNEPPLCLACGGEYRILEPDHDPSATCDGCAHGLVVDLVREVIRLRQEAARRG